MQKKKKKKQKKNSEIKTAKKTSQGIGWLIALAAIVLVILAIIIVIVANAAKETSSTQKLDAETTASDEVTPLQEDPAPVEDTTSENFDFDATYYADITVADYGTITVALDAQSAPISVSNFVNLAKDGFYDGLTFHRIMAGFMMQGGDPTGTGNGGSGQTIKGEFSANGVQNNLSHIRGAISMARANDFNSASSQFFIVHEDSTFLDGQYACFGYVTEGMEYVDAICNDAHPIDNNGTIDASEQPVIESIVIREE